jgi:N-hydroxyarylamine O-acetyltransferase
MIARARGWGAIRVRRVFDLDGYPERIGLSGRPDLAEVHRAHSTSIPFENLDPRRGIPASVALEDLERKLVVERRGGYCFEQNLLLKAALEALGAEVEMYLARVRYRAVPGVVRPRSHLLLRVEAAGESWHADVGFGAGTLFEPLPFGPGDEVEQAGWRYRVVQDEAELVLQGAEEDGWVDLYGFRPDPVPLVDVETINWWVSTYPGSPFVTGLMVTLQHEDGLRVGLSDWGGGLTLTERTASSTTVTPVDPREAPELLANRFALAGQTIAGAGSELGAGRPAAA